MCVIMLAEHHRLTPEMVKAAIDHNKDGAGVAWRENGKVRWEKGMGLEDALRRCAEVPLPYVFHARIASCGGICSDLTHPFPIDDNAPLKTSGATKGWVLFHNGHWGDWRKDTWEAMRTIGKPIPTGKWSDSRAMAVLASIYGLGALEFINEKVIAFGPKEQDLEIFGPGWSVHEEKWMVSNTFWKPTQYRTGYVGAGNKLCAHGPCNKHCYGGSDYCYEHQYKGSSGTTELPVVSTKKEEPKQEEKKESKKGGGPAEVIPFHRGNTTVQSGEVESKQVEEVTASPSGSDEAGSGDGSQSNDGALVPIPPVSTEDGILYRWASTLNLKPLRRPRPVDGEVILH